MLKLFITSLLVLIYHLVGFCQMNPKSQDYPYDDTPETKKIALQITQGVHDDSIKVIALYNWVVKNIDYDSVRYERYFKNNILDTTPKVNNCSTTLANHKAVCTGYAILFSTMCEHLGIKAMPIMGYSKSLKEKVEKADHAWVTFRINSKWYLADPTWDSNLFKYKTRREEKLANNEYFMANPQFFLRTHFPLDPIWQLSESPMTFSYWKNDESSDSIQKFTFIFNLKDSLNKFEVLDKHNQFLNSVNRIAQQDEYAFYGLHELFEYYAMLFKENAIEYDHLRRKITTAFNSRTKDEPTKHLVGFKQELLPRLNTQERYFRYVKNYYEKFSQSRLKNKAFFWEIKDMKSDFGQLDRNFIEERKSLNMTIRYLEGLRKK